MNISLTQPFEETAAQLFRVLGQPLRIQILLMLSREDACVCHLEAHLGARQALLSQHLMVLRDAGLVTFYRQGRNIYYQLAVPVLPLLDEVASQVGCDTETLRQAAAQPLTPCPCPRCNPQTSDEVCCGNPQPKEKDETCQEN